MVILNIAAGKMLTKPQDLPFYDPNMPVFIVNLDMLYLNGLSGKDIENEFDIWDEEPDRISETYKCTEDVFNFLNNTTIKFDYVIMNRFLEHISFTQVSYFIYLLSTVCNKGANVDVIVPNYETLAKMILNEQQFAESNNFGNHDFQDFEAWNILLTTEVVNEPGCPHASIWTPYRVKYFWELEKLFKITNLWEEWTFDGRDIYLKFEAERK